MKWIFANWWVQLQSFGFQMISNLHNITSTIYGSILCGIVFVSIGESIGTLQLIYMYHFREKSKTEKDQRLICLFIGHKPVRTQNEIVPWWNMMIEYHKLNSSHIRKTRPTKTHLTNHDHALGTFFLKDSDKSHMIRKLNAFFLRSHELLYPNFVDKSKPRTWAAAAKATQSEWFESFVEKNWILVPIFTKHFRYLKWRISWTWNKAIFLGVGEIPYISRIHTAYIGKSLHFRYLKCLVIYLSQCMEYQSTVY